MSEPASSLIAQAAARDAAAPALFSFSDFESSREQMQKERGEFTGERLFRDRPEVYAAVVSALGEGMSIRRIARAYRVSPNTVVAVQEREGSTIDAEKKGTVRTLRTFVRLAAERLVEEVDNIPLQSLPIAMGISVEKSELLDGGATSRIERVDPREVHREAERFIEGLVIDAQETGLSGGADAQKAIGAAGSILADLEGSDAADREGVGLEGGTGRSDRERAAGDLGASVDPARGDGESRAGQSGDADGYVGGYAERRLEGAASDGGGCSGAGAGIEGEDGRRGAAAIEAAGAGGAEAREATPQGGEGVENGGGEVTSTIHQERGEL